MEAIDRAKKAFLYRREVSSSGVSGPLGWRTFRSFSVASMYDSDATINRMKTFSWMAVGRRKMLIDGGKKRRTILTVIFLIGNIGNAAQGADFHDVQPVDYLEQFKCLIHIL